MVSIEVVMKEKILFILQCLGGHTLYPKKKTKEVTDAINGALTMIAKGIFPVLLLGCSLVKRKMP